MASDKSEGQLTRKQMVPLAALISVQKMAAIAEGYMDISDETIKNIKFENKDDAVNREIIKYWLNKNSGGNQILVSTTLN